MLTNPAQSLSGASHKQEQQIDEVSHVYLLFMCSDDQRVQSADIHAPVMERVFQYTEEPAPANGDLRCRASQLVDATRAWAHTGESTNRLIGGAQCCLTRFSSYLRRSSSPGTCLPGRARSAYPCWQSGLSALLTASLTPYYVSFIKLPNQGLATVAYYIVTYLLLYVLIAVPAIILSSIIKIAITGLLLGLVTHLLPVSISTSLLGESRIYPLMAPLFVRLPPIDLRRWEAGSSNLLPGSR